MILYPISQNLKYGFIDSKGRVVIKPQFVMVKPFSEGLAAVAIGTIENHKFAFIDETGKIVFEVNGSPSEKGFSSGVAAVLADSSSSSYYINKTGKLIAAYFADAEDCTEGLCAVRMNSMGPNHYGYIDTSGAVIVKGQFDSAAPFSDGIARVGVFNDNVNGAPVRKYGYIDRTGKPIIPLKFDMVVDFSDGLAQAKIGDKWGYINRTGDLVIAPQFEETQPFKDGLARVKVNGLWGFIDKSGKTTITPQFETVDDFYEDWAAARLGGRAVYVDRSGRVALTTSFDRVNRFRNGAAIVSLKGKGGLINRAGKLIVSPQFRSMQMVSDELILVEDEATGFGYINYRGAFIWKPTY